MMLVRQKLWLLLLLVLLQGCASSRQEIHQALKARNLSEDQARVARSYQIRSPDVVRITVPGHEAWNGEHEVGVDGHLHFDNGLSLLAEGRTPPDLAEELALQLGLEPARVEVVVTRYNSQKLFLTGELKGEDQVLEYRGPESVVGLIQRVGGFTGGAAPRELRIVRPRVAEGKPPQLFHVDPKELLMDEEKGLGPRLQPFDQIYVAESWKASVERKLPPWLRPIYGRLFGLSAPEPLLTPGPRMPVLKEKVQDRGRPIMKWLRR